MVMVVRAIPLAQRCLLTVALTSLAVSSCSSSAASDSGSGAGGNGGTGVGWGGAEGSKVDASLWDAHGEGAPGVVGPGCDSTATAKPESTNLDLIEGLGPLWKWCVVTSSGGGMRACQLSFRTRLRHRRVRQQPTAGRSFI